MTDRVSASGSGESQPTSPAPPTMPAIERESTVAFVFDIDGVLVKGKNPLPKAQETIELLQRLDVPFIFLTNGGGLTEEAHVARLGERLSIPSLDQRQFVQSHTPYHNLVKLYADKPILVLGGHGDQIRNLAKAYGFNKVMTSSDLYADMPAVHPFPEMTQEHHAKFGRKGHFPADTSIAAILVWSSPRDWMLDIQVVLDLLLSTGGVISAPRSAKNGDNSLPNNGYLQDNQPKLYFCNPDFEWATQAPVPRLAQGGFLAALQGVWSCATSGADLPYQTCGKPTELTYEFAETALSRWNERSATTSEVKLLAEFKDIKINEDISRTTTVTVREIQEPRQPREISTAYMIGDNEMSDVRGANAFVSRLGYEWKSVLVETGVYVAGTAPIYEPSRYAKNVHVAVTEILQENGFAL